MARLLNDEDNDGRRFVDQRGGGSYYSFETLVHDQIDQVTSSKGNGKVEDLIYSGDIWDVE